MRKSVLAVICVVSSFCWADAMKATRLLVVVGIVKEAKLVQGGKNVSLLISGASSERLVELLENENPADVRAIISFGVAGGLNPGHETGDVIIPDAVIKDGHTWLTDSILSENFRSKLKALGITVRNGTLVGSNAIIANPADKAKLFATSKADAVDMESHVAAAYAAKYGIPFAAIRVISDPADRSLPQAALDAVTSEGEVELLPILRGIWRDFSQIGKLLRAGLDSRKAFGALARCQVLLGG